MVEGSLLLAEDRILSYMALLMPKCDAAIRYVPSATFYFEAETDPGQLLSQRRRWINGTVAGYLWLLQNWKLIKQSHLGLVKKMMLVFLVSCQLMLYAMVAVGPAIFGLGIYFVLNGTFGENPRNDVYVYCYITLYLLFVCVH